MIKKERKERGLGREWVDLIGINLWKPSVGPTPEQISGAGSI